MFGLDIWFPFGTDSELAWVRVRMTGPTQEETICLYDHGGGDCDEEDLGREPGPTQRRTPDMHKSLRTIVAASAAVALAAAAITAPVAAGPNKKGTTFVVPSETTGEVLKKVLKPGKLTEKGAAFRIVGNPGKGPIKHVGGLKLHTLDESDQPNGTVKLRNFRIQVADGVVLGNVQGVGRAPLFTFDPADAADDVGDPEVTLLFTEAAASVIGGSVDLTGMEAGVATIELK